MTTHALLKRILKAPEFIRDHEWGAAVHRSLELMFSGELAKSSVIAQYAVCAFWRYGMPTLITRSSNNYGPRQYPEKLIPLTIKKALAGEPIPVYGDGLNVRDWLYVEDNCRAIDAVLRKATPGITYNVGGGNELSNIDLIHLLLHALAEQTGKPEEDYTRLITFVPDRPGHDRRYALDSAKLSYMIGMSFDRWLCGLAAMTGDPDHSSDNLVQRLLKWLVVERQPREIGSDSSQYVGQNTQRGE